MQPSGHAGQPSAEAGFTLIETLVVLVILGLVAGIVMARGPSRSASLELRLAATAVAQSLRLARTDAITTGEAVRVVIDTSAGTLRVGARPLRTVPPAIGLAVTAAADETSGALAAIRFLPDGSSTGGTVTLASGSRRASVGVDWLTGRVAAADGP